MTTLKPNIEQTCYIPCQMLVGFKIVIALPK